MISSSVLFSPPLKLVQKAGHLCKRWSRWYSCIVTHEGRSMKPIRTDSCIGLLMGWSSKRGKIEKVLYLVKHRLIIKYLIFPFSSNSKQFCDAKLIDCETRGCTPQLRPNLINNNGLNDIESKADQLCEL